MADWDKYWDSLGGLASVAGRHLPERVDLICEYGGGYSTFFFSLIAEIRHTSVFCSVDQCPPYLARLRATMPKGNRFTPVLADQFSEDRLKSDGPDALYYATAPLHFGKTMDLVYVDGRTRMECLLVAALASSTDAVIILDDADRVRYTPGLLLYEEIDRIVRFRVLRVRPEVFPLRDRFQVSLHRFKDKAVVAPKEGRDRGMLHVPVLDPLNEAERYALEGLAGNLPEPILCWGGCDLASALSTNGREVLHISERTAGALNGVSVIASLTGGLMDLSHDPNLHYSTAALFWGRRFPSVVVGGHRRNECLLTSAYIVEPGGVVLLRDPDHLTFQPGLAMYERVGSEGPFGAFRLRPDALTFVTATRGDLERLTSTAAIGQPGEAA